MLYNPIPQSAEELALRMIVLVTALMLDWLFGEPDMLWRRIPHPVVLFGRATGLAEQFGNRRKAFHGLTRRRAGIGAMLVLASVAGFVGIGVSLGGVLAELVVLTILLAGRSLDDHIRAVSSALGENMQAARDVVAMIVGRDTNQMDDADIARAAIETGAENLSDGVIAPAFWFLLLGLPGLLIYKMINTADSMIGYRNARYLAFGWAAARLDDLVNLIPARLTGLIYALLAQAPVHALTAMVKDAPRHRSPNAGWPESAVASALGIRLSGPRLYNCVASSDPWLNKAGRDPGPQDITAALQLYRRLLWVVSLLLLSGAVCLFLAEKGANL